MSLEEKTKTDGQIRPDNGQDDESVTKGTMLNTHIDDVILRANGHSQAMKRQFSWVSALGLGFSITNSWIGYLSTFGQSMIYGGPQVVLLGLIVAFVVQFVITVGLAEIASAFPSSGGQYHFCFILSPEKTKHFSGYVIGWMSIIAWWVVTCSGISLAANTLGGMISFFEPDFVATRWQIYLFYVATALITAIPVFVASKKLAWVVQISLIMSVVGMFMTLFVVVGVHDHVQDASALMQSGQGDSGWNPGTAWLLGISNCMYAFGGTDGALHISEEMSHPGRRVPQVMILTMIIGLVTSFPLFLALLFFTTDLDAVANSPLPSMELIYQACGTRGVTMFLITWILILYVVCIPSQWVTSGRIAWAFARDNGVPFSKYFSKIDRKLEFPVRTTFAAMVFVLLYGLLYLASTTAFNSIVTSAVLFLNITYAVPQGILLMQGREKSLPSRYLNLHWFGYLCNVFSVLWVIVLGVFICLPPSLPVTTSSMNYISVVSVGLFSIIILFWFISGRKKFDGPQIDWDLINEANSTDLHGVDAGQD